MSAQEAVVDIVLVEDDPSDADLIVRALTRAGLACAVRVLEDGA
jgi:two-component system response regulator